MLGTVIGVLVSAFITGALARFAVPGPDPMPAWLRSPSASPASRSAASCSRTQCGHRDAVTWSGIAGFFVADPPRRRLPALRPEAGALGRGGVPLPEARPRRRAVPRAAAARRDRPGQDRHRGGRRSRSRRRRRSPRRPAPSGTPAGADRESGALPRPARGAARLPACSTTTSTTPPACACSSGCAARRSACSGSSSSLAAVGPDRRRARAPRAPRPRPDGHLRDDRARPRRLASSAAWSPGCSRPLGRVRVLARRRDRSCSTCTAASSSTGR